jgi:hypothetical protein
MIGDSKEQSHKDIEQSKKRAAEESAQLTKEQKMQKEHLANEAKRS